MDPRSSLQVSGAPSHRRHRRTASRLLIIASALLLAIASIDLAGAQAQRIDGDVVSVDGSTLRLRAKGGELSSVSLGDAVRYSARSASTPARIVQGAYIGTTAVPGPDGTLTAVEVHIFAESMRGTGEGHRPMAGPPGSTMTNATVGSLKSASRSTMTNANVAGAAGTASGLRLTLTYAGGEKVVVVPDSTPVELIEPADRSALVAGTHVLVYAAPGPSGGLVAERINIGKDGYVPTR
jgi:hypothetical protein